MATILLVEGDDQVRVLTGSFLEQQGHRLLSAGTPDGAIAILKKTEHVDLLFTDVDLKGEISAGIDLATERTSRREEGLHGAARLCLLRVAAPIATNKDACRP